MSETLPEGCECRVDFYLTSDETGLEVVVGLSGLRGLPKIGDAKGAALDLVGRLGVETNMLEDLASDWRLMRRDEIADYQKRQDAPGRVIEEEIEL